MCVLCDTPCVAFDALYSQNIGVLHVTPEDLSLRWVKLGGDNEDKAELPFLFFFFVGTYIGQGDATPLNLSVRRYPVNLTAAKKIPSV